MAESKISTTKTGIEEISLWERPTLLEELGQQYHGAAVHIVTEGPLPGEADHCRLQHILYAANNVVFFMECDNNSETRFTIANPERLIVDRNSAGEVSNLQIVSLDGSVTRVWFGDAVGAKSPDDIAA
jgi:hypothetical protein